MKSKLSSLKILSLISLCLVAGAGIYYHFGFSEFVNNVVYPDAKIPVEHRSYVYYFMDEKIRFKKVAALIYVAFSVISTILLGYYNGGLKLIKVVVVLQVIVILGWLFLYLFIPKGIFVT